MNNKRQNQAQIAYKEIRKSLIARSLSSGQRLAENTWADKLEVNRADVKQAMSRLQGEGLLTAGAKGGFFVKEFTPDELEEFYEVRGILETAAAERAITNATEEELNQLESIALLMQNLAENGYLLGLKEADLDFHETLVKCAHNKKLELLYQMANLPISGSTDEPSDKQLLTQTVDDHLLIVQNIRAGNKDEVLRILNNQFHPTING